MQLHVFQSIRHEMLVFISYFCIIITNLNCLCLKYHLSLIIQFHELEAQTDCHFYEEEVYKLQKYLNKKRSNDLFTGKDFTQYLEDNQNCLDSISSKLKISSKYNTKDWTQKIGKHLKVR